MSTIYLPNLKEIQWTEYEIEYHKSDFLVRSFLQTLMGCFAPGSRQLIFLDPGQLFWMWKWKWRDLRFRLISWICDVISVHHLEFPVTGLLVMSLSCDFFPVTWLLVILLSPDFWSGGNITGNPRWWSEVAPQIQDGGRNRKSFHLHFHIQKVNLTTMSNKEKFQIWLLTWLTNGLPRDRIN